MRADGGNMEPRAPRDLHVLPPDGYLVLPLSMSRIAHGQDPGHCYEVIQHFEKKIAAVGIDFVFLYTNGLYYNNAERALDVRKRTNGQMLAHKNAIIKRVEKSKKYITQAMHPLPWDYVVLNAPRYQEFIDILTKRLAKDEEFRAHLLEGLKGRAADDANIAFLIEEIVVSHLIRQRMVEFPKTLVKQDRYRLIVYPGPPLKADIYQWKRKILPRSDTAVQKENPFYASHYDFDAKIIYHFDDMVLD